MHNAITYPGAIRELRFILKRIGAQKVFLVTGRNSYALSGAKSEIENQLSDFNCVEFKEFQVNPDLEDVEAGVKLFEKENCDVIIAVGGGSAIDVAKLINYYHHSSLEDLSANSLENKEFSPVSLICIPTTAGSGSEATHFAVIYVQNIKHSIADTKLMPVQTIIDPTLHYSQTPYQKAVSGIDAFAQAIESLWNVHSTDESVEYAEQAIKTIWLNLEKAVLENDENAHWALALGANLAGRAINITKTTAPHALSYGFTKALGLPHGHSVALSIPFFIKYHAGIQEAECNDNRGAGHVKQVIDRIAFLLDVQTEALSREVFLFFERLGVSVKFSELKISKQLFKEIAKGINYERLKNNPGKVDVQVLDALFEFNSAL
ncbi:phosphonoacetaldehyde reductase [Natronoflexus pectinivorans]|uniref:Alcohol dehydrogenase class IV n=1 Tax=Natronoflexus pectinivorans TaxID=682526 RepID=A0A4R2GIV9_9BACT|nr:phosphonoacetaldehyde reductase [Natronoflexus pectinivorans]TCO07872.1 alcohol dehydrogenase class IV [Natronoflexus pectinivorans]